jgi:uncharacterized membrane protein
MRLYRALAIAACGSAAVLWSQLALARLSTVHHHTFDLAQYTRLAWGLAHGQPWDAIVGGNILGGHMPWVLAPLGVIGAAVNALSGDGLGTAKTLLVAQACAMALSAYPIFRLAARRLGSAAGAMIAVAYLAYPTLGHVATYEMHPGSLALLPLAIALDALDTRATRTFVIACLCALPCRASLGLELMALGALAALAARDDARVAALLRGTRSASATFAHIAGLQRAGLSVAAVGLAYLALSMFVLGPRFGAAAAGATGSLDLHFGPWGGSPFGIVGALFTRPGDVLEHLSAPARLNFVPMVLAPLAFVALLAPRTLLLAVPTIAINLASVFPTTTRIDSHYLTMALPAFAVSTIYGVQALGRIAPRFIASLQGAALSLRPLTFAVLAVSLLANASAGGMPWSLDYVPGDFRAGARTYAARAALAVVPSGASVQAPDALLPHLAERTTVHRGPPPDRGTRYAVLDLSHRELYARREDLIRTQQEPIARGWLARPELGIALYSAPYVVLARGLNPRAGFARRYFGARERARPAPSDVRLTACVAVRSATIEARNENGARKQLVLALTLRPDGPCPSDLALRVDLPVSRPLGDAAHPRVDLPCDGLLSPAHWRSGDLIRSRHPLNEAELADIERYGLWLGALRSSGARPDPTDPVSARVAVIP